jgi:probable HAF family extracellular repeat protein
MLFPQVIPIPFNIFTPRLGTVQTQAIGINASGHIVGGYSKDGDWHGFLYSGGTSTTLGPPGMLGTSGHQLRWPFI